MGQRLIDMDLDVSHTDGWIISIFHVFLVWMGNSIPRLVTAYAALRPQQGRIWAHIEFTH